MFAWFIAALVIWIIGPSVYDLLGCGQRKDLSVYDNYCTLQLLRKYESYKYYR